MQLITEINEKTMEWEKVKNIISIKEAKNKILARSIDKNQF